MRIKGKALETALPPHVATLHRKIHRLLKESPNALLAMAPTSDTSRTVKAQFILAITTSIHQLYDEVEVVPDSLASIRLDDSIAAASAVDRNWVDDVCSVHRAPCTSVQYLLVPDWDLCSNTPLLLLFLRSTFRVGWLSGGGKCICRIGCTSSGCGHNVARFSPHPPIAQPNPVFGKHGMATSVSPRRPRAVEILPEEHQLTEVVDIDSLPSLMHDFLRNIHGENLEEIRLDDKVKRRLSAGPSITNSSMTMKSEADV
ncbi:hypothetical protein DFH07DRAFT_220842 [Mycena maculata]|uniref:Uncharacterized protein n=1 Tax=Mycena maculata TaxID=230809 RepID=A0AAD7HUZ2_9AGAR|nr:hypothetical protein DFH07DRAFT_220842 [Mycena maculata]